MRKVHLYIDGMVKAVGYRAFLVRHAQELEIKGYVRNIDGGAEAVAEGEDEAIAAFIELAKKGPSAARVMNVDIEEEVPNYLFKDFSIRP